MKKGLILAALLLGACGGIVRADSLWAKGQKESLFVDKKARHVGDLVTILIEESTVSTQTATTNVSKKDQSDVAKGTGFLLNLIPKLGFQGSSAVAAQGSTSRNSNLSARMTAKVIEVKPNGTMVLEGTRSLTTTNDTQTLKLTGIVRPEDIAPDNTVRSTFLADAKIDVTGKGPISERQKPGIINRLLKVLF